MLGLLKGLQEVDDENEYLLFAQDDDLDGFGVYKDNFKFIPCSSKTLRKQWVRIIWEQVVFPWRLRKAKADVLLCPNYSMPYPVRLVHHKMAVVNAFHDMAYFMFPELYIGWKREIFKWYIRRSARSRNTGIPAGASVSVSTAIFFAGAMMILTRASYASSASICAGLSAAFTLPNAFTMTPCSSMR